MSSCLIVLIGGMQAIASTEPDGSSVPFHLSLQEVEKQFGAADLQGTQDSRKEGRQVPGIDRPTLLNRAGGTMSWAEF